MNILKKIFLCAVLLLFGGIAAVPLRAADTTQGSSSPKILLIGANDPSFSFHIRVAQSIAIKLKDQCDAEVDILFTTPFGDDDAWVFSLRDKLYAELRTRKYDAIVVNHWANEETLDALQSMTLTNIPIITYFTNSLSPEQELRRSKEQVLHNQTVLMLNNSQLDNLKLALALNPKIRDVFFCSEYSDEEFEHGIDAWQKKNAPKVTLHYAYSDQVTLEQLEHDVRAAAGQTAIILNSAWHDMSTNKIVPYELLISKLKFASGKHEPLFLSGNILGIEYGCAAGYVVSINEYGEQTARLVAQVLSQKGAGEVAPIRLEPMPFANYPAFTRAKLSERIMPGNTIWLLKPQSFLYLHRYVISVSGAIIAILVIFISILIYSRCRILKLNASLKASTDEAQASRYAAQMEIIRFRCTIESIGDAVIVTDLNEKITLVNAVAAQLIGQPAEKLIGQQLCDKFKIHNYITGESVVSPLTKAVTEKTIVTLSNHVDLEAFDGKSYHIADCASPIFSPDGKVTGGVLIFRDVTADYEKREQLEKAVEAAQTADKAKSYFLATMSHEIRTPLNVVIGFTELLATGAISKEEESEIISSISFAGNALLSLINDVLDISKLEAGQFKFNCTFCSVASIAQEICAIFKQKAAEKGISIAVTEERTLPLLFLDAPRIKQILLNLIGNAVKFTHFGGVTVHIDFVPDTGETGTLSIAITDTGIGIPEAFLAHLFQPFTQADSTHASRKYEGTGLGLAITEKLTKAMNGEISVTSVEGKGSTFLFQLRKLKFQVPEVAVSVGASSKLISESAKRTILLVDDVKSNLLILEHMFKSVGVLARSVLTPREALQLIDSHCYDMILTDIWMPEMNGYELMKTIRKKPGFEKFKIIAITADSDIQTTFDMSDFDDVIFKPITRDKLCSILKTTGDLAVATKNRTN